MAEQIPPADLPQLPARAADTSKRDYGRVLVIGGAAGMAGAPALTAMAALRSGAGLVEAVVPDAVVTISAGFDPCVMTLGLASRADGTFASDAEETILERARASDAVAVGPGLGRTDATAAIVARLWRELPQPAVFDADALWAIARPDRQRLAIHAGPRILTPHAGEMLRLVGLEAGSDAGRDRPRLEAEAIRLAAEIDAVILLKGPATLVVDRQRQARNPTGNPGMATAGTGDVLTGVIAALLAQRLPAFDAARLAAWVHGRAGDRAAADLGEISMTARDLLERLSGGFRDRTAGPAG